MSGLTDRLKLPADSHGLFQLDEGNVSPTRPAGRDAHGLPREETICQLAKVEKFVDPKGNVCDVPLQTGRVPSQEVEAQRYELYTRYTQIRAGCLPLAECPLTSEYKRWTGSESLIDNPSGEKACDGAPDGCAHLKPVIEARRKIAREEWEAQQKNAQQMTAEQVEAIALALGAGIGQKLQGFGNTRSRLRDGRSDKDE